jgi:hypothetical protein
MQNLQMLYTSVLRVEIATIFSLNVVAITKGCIFRILQHFATKLCDFNHFSMLFLAMVTYLYLLA